MSRERALHLFLLVPLIAAVFSGCEQDTEKQQVEKTILSVRTAAENRDAGGILEHLSRSYRDSRAYDYDGIKGLLLFLFLRHQSVAIMMTGLEVDIRGSAADARFQAVLSGRTGSAGTILPEALGAYQFTVMLSKEAGDWKITSANWKRMGDQLPE